MSCSSPFVEVELFLVLYQYLHLEVHKYCLLYIFVDEGIEFQTIEFQYVHYSAVNLICLYSFRLYLIYM